MGTTLEIKQSLLPIGHKLRQGTRIKPTFITVHNTANASVGANAEQHARYLLNGAGGRQVSWHYTVDDKGAVQHLPVNERGWHAGTTEGNDKSIGIEICENADGDFAKARVNAIELIRKLMAELCIPLENVVPHKHWSGKPCPRLLLATWPQFIEDLKPKPVPVPVVEPTPVASPVVPQWKIDVHNEAKRLGIITSDWTKQLDEPAPVWMVLACILNARKAEK